ncbi:MazG nucleotide pyrophosphohydrolase domain-containing protein [Sulfobacillus harzensis]|uniref:Nucleotide pyrophosphohydrolase n=1 Tax=Sulfobacillus harzensis TaxID=2729629 RepID=A0A7Y0L1J3_9FIRM|nr:MazG nucleotide pyrophosphohydrolase domain-containing protein [Sulfobacillus harzensis]NMP21505.1 nucleotide pyrophosphohydrolase [Sulfobacillus harzensis]
MADWVWHGEDGNNRDDRFIVQGPRDGAAIWERFGALFPDDAKAQLWVSGSPPVEILWGDIAKIQLMAGDRLILPGIPTAGGPLLYVMERLLGPEGCPWDRKQTPQSLVRYLLDESYEAAEALVAGDDEAFIEELGDVLLQIAFQGALAPNSSFSDIAVKQAQKLIRRHPHVFAEEAWATSEEVRQQWDKLKAQEPPHHASAVWVYPALVAAKRLDKLGIHPESSVYQEIYDLLQVYFDKNPGKIEEILADAAWAVASGGRIQHQDAEWALWKKVAQAAPQNREIAGNLR